MKLEHTAYNVSDPKEATAWYIKHLGFTVVRQMDEPPFTHFLADDSGQALLEIYNNPPDQVPDYKSMDPLLFHLAFVSGNPEADCARLIEAGASLVEGMHTPAGDHLIMLRDPWGLAIQLCCRKNPML